jgi:MFS family permease
MSVLLVLVGLAALDSYIFGTAMPRVIADLGGFDRYASVTTGYLLTSTLAIAVTGKMSEHYGRKPFLLAGVAAFVVGSSYCNSAPSGARLPRPRASRLARSVL